MRLPLRTFTAIGIALPAIGFASLANAQNYSDLPPPKGAAGVERKKSEAAPATPDALSDFATADALATLRARLGLDLPVWQQYGVFLLRAAQGDMGVSVVTGQSALAEIWAAVPPSATLEAKYSSPSSV